MLIADGCQLPFSLAYHPARWAFDADQNVKSRTRCAKSEIDRATIYEAARWEKLLEGQLTRRTLHVPPSIFVDVLRGA